MRPEQELQTVDQIARVRAELASGDFLSNARARSRRRKSTWNLLLPLVALPLYAATTLGLVALGHGVHGLLRGSHEALGAFMAGAIRPSTALVLFPSLLAAVAPALLFTNFIVYLIPAARRAMELEDRNFPGTGYAASQSALARLAAWLLVAWVFGVLVACAFP